MAVIRDEEGEGVATRNMREDLIEKFSLATIECDNVKDVKVNKVDIHIFIDSTQGS